jgi:hypothetical protein
MDTTAQRCVFFCLSLGNYTPWYEEWKHEVASLMFLAWNNYGLVNYCIVTCPHLLIEAKPVITDASR